MNMMVVMMDQMLMLDLIEIYLLEAKVDYIEDDIFQVLKIQLNHIHLIAYLHK